METGFSTTAAGALVVGRSVEEAPLESAPENQHRRGLGEVPVHAVVARLGHPVGDLDLLPYAQVRLAFDEGVPAELAGHDHDRPVQKPPFLQVQDQLGDGAVDGPLEVDHAVVAVLVRVEVAKRDVPGGDLHEPDARLDEPAGQEAALAEAAGAVTSVDSPRAPGTGRRPRPPENPPGGGPFPGSGAATPAGRWSPVEAPGSRPPAGGRLGSGARRGPGSPPGAAAWLRPRKTGPGSAWDRTPCPGTRRCGRP